MTISPYEDLSFGWLDIQLFIVSGLFIFGREISTRGLYEGCTVSPRQSYYTHKFWLVVWKTAQLLMIYILLGSTLKCVWDSQLDYTYYYAPPRICDENGYKNYLAREILIVEGCSFIHELVIFFLLPPSGVKSKRDMILEVMHHIFALGIIWGVTFLHAGRSLPLLGAIFIFFYRIPDVVFHLAQVFFLPLLRGSPHFGNLVIYITAIFFVVFRIALVNVLIYWGWSDDLLRSVTPFEWYYGFLLAYFFIDLSQIYYVWHVVVSLKRRLLKEQRYIIHERKTL